MGNKLLFGLLFFLLIFSLYLGFSLRRINYAEIPEPFLILDERTNVWHGLSLRSTGVPAAWSQLEAYKKNNHGGEVDKFNIKVDKNYPTLATFKAFPYPNAILYPVDLGLGRGLKHVQLVQPYLDHPPLGALILSSLVNTSTVKTFTDLAPHEFRRTSIVLSVVTGLLIFVLGWQIFQNPWVGLMASFVYNLTPSYLLLSRYALLENVMVPLILLMLIILQLGQKFRICLALAGILAGLSALTKISGWAAIILGGSMLWLWKFSVRRILLFVLPAIFLGLLYFIWGLLLAPNVFLDIFRYQGIEREFIGSLNFLIAVAQVGIRNFPFDGFWIGGFLSLLFLPKMKNNLILIASVLFLLLTPLLLGGANYSWYFIPLIPFLCLSIAYFFWQVINFPTLVNVLTFFLIFFSSSFYWGIGVWQRTQPFTVYRLFLVLFTGLALFWFYCRSSAKIQLIWQIFMVLLLIAMIKLNENSFLYILNHWGHLPSLFTPGTFD